MSNKKCGKQKQQSQIDRKKYINTILYFLTYGNNQFLGKTKLNKLLYYFDFLTYKQSNSSATGDSYVHLDYGPVPENIDEILVEMKSKGLIDVETVILSNNGEKQKFTPNREPDKSVFSKDELELLDKLVDKFEMWPTDKIVDQTHLEAPWFYSEPYERVSYDYANDIDILETADVA